MKYKKGAYMANQKLETLLNVSMQATQEDRAKSPDLSAGVDEEAGIWEVIVKYTQDLSQFSAKYPGMEIYELLGGYAIIKIKKEYIDSLSREKQIQFIEKPKRLYFQLSNEKSDACITPVQAGSDNPYGLFGEGVITAIIDSGIDVTNPDFKNENGTTRIIGIWDQDRDIFYDSSQIDRYLDGENPKGMRSQRAPGFDISGHGTNVARIACGNRGVASKSDILVVKMGNTDRTSFPGTTQLIKGVDFCIKKAADLGKPVAINISYGNNYGDHSGSSIQESFINTASASWKCAICVGSGNEGLGAGHTSGRLIQGEEQYVRIAVSEYETSLNIQIWKDYWDDFNIEVITPAGINLGRISRYNTLNTVSTGTEKVLCYYAQPLPFSMRQEIYIDIVPVNNYITSGLWRINFIPDKIRTGFFDMWLPAAASLNPKTGFTRPDSSLTYTVPSTSSNVITVGSYNAATNTPSPFSGRGYVTQSESGIAVKPDIVAPGENVRIDERTIVSGTSYAVPFVTGASALLMEWGIVRGNDLFLYGEKLKAHLIKGALPLNGMNIPDEVTGWGKMCMAQSI